MEMPQQFCLRWNNYQSTLHHVFHKLWTSGTFVDVSLVVEGKRIDCHKVILSACSTYFEQLLSEHSAHPHPLVLLHDIPYTAVESLVTFMYKGEINVSHDQLTALLKVAESLKIKGLADSAVISNFSKFRLLSPEVNKLANSQYLYPPPTPLANTPYIPPHTSGNSAARCYSMPSVKSYQTSTPTYTQSSGTKCSEPSSVSPTNPPRKRPRVEEPTSLPPSPPISLEEPQNNEQARASPQDNCRISPQIKTETEEETDTELQIDLSGQSPTDSADSEGPSNSNTPIPDAEARELNERHETAQSLAAFAAREVKLDTNSLAQPRQLPMDPKRIKEEKKPSGGKNGEKAYTIQDLEEGIEAVLMGHLTPAKAIAKFKVPRRTFFRRLSAVRKLRGIPSSKENASEHYLNAGSARSAAAHQIAKKAPPSLVVPGIASGEPNYLQNISKVPKIYPEDGKKDKKIQGLNLTSGSVFSLLNVVANPNYEYYLKYLKLQSQNQGRDISSAEDQKEPVIEEKISSEAGDQALGLVSQNGTRN